METTTTNPQLARLKRFSYILNPGLRGDRNPLLSESSISDLKREIYHLIGENGKILNEETKVLEPAKIPMLEQQLKDLDKRFKRAQSDALNQGDRPLKTMPPDLQEQKEYTENRLTVANEELSYLEEKLKTAKIEIAPDSLPPILPRQEWSHSKLLNGMLHSVGGMLCSKNASGIMIISDDRSPYQGMPVWQFKSQIVNAMAQEYKHRTRNESKLAELERRPPQPVAYPLAPIINKTTKAIEYHGFSNATIKKLKSST